MARKKLTPELKAKNHTFKLYDWEVEKVKAFIKSLRVVSDFRDKLIDAKIETIIKNL